ncbi:hypothetical protein NM208_g8311 [Fusarium decemcellulare]|uniref:Uncharacterized protein n=1 Tax=Fusarium decemcellulare TaxID=57161 RepID=A0ACC1S5U5_9HYPO|nr:hypothetical protein NM208_g8311 [Fusarium decemcellulare]
MATNPDNPIPSTENNQSPLSGISSTPGTSPNRLRTPSVSVTPPQPSRNGTALPRDNSQDEVAAGINNIRLSEPNGVANLSEVAEAVERVARGPRRSSGVDSLPHDVLEEELPQDAFHAPEFQQAFRDAKQLMSTVEGVLGSSRLHNDPDSTMSRLFQEARRLSQFEYPSTRTVGFVGDSGVGKSSLLNSLLDTKGLARTSNSGEACTCVVTEYRYHNRESFDIEVDLFSMDELRDQWIRLLQVYRHFHLHQDEIDDADKQDAEANAKVAIDTFRAMFRGQLNDGTFLIIEEEHDILQKFTRWATSARPSAFVTRQTGLSLQACSNALMELSSEPPARNRPATWPYIKITKVSLNAHILSRGLILVDLPGLRDLNSARKMITEQYVKRCNEIFAICNIGRAVTDEGVYQMFELARQAHLSNVGIEIQADEAMKDWRGEKAKQIKRYTEAIDTDTRDWRNVQEELADYEGDDLDEEEKDYQRKLLLQQSNISTRKKNHEFELKKFLVETRNTFVTRELRNKYNARVSTDEIKVFCVSNKDYWGHRDEPKRKAKPFLDLSGILQVRKHCISIVANSQRRIATRYMKDEIPVFLADVNLWVQSGARTASEERREALCQRLDEVERQLRREFTSSSSVVNRVAHSYKRNFKDHIYGPRRISSWSRSARGASSEWSGWHHGELPPPSPSDLPYQLSKLVGQKLLRSLAAASYSAFCRNFGDHSTPTIGTRNWNEEAIQGMVEDLETPWDDLCESLEQHQVDISDHIEAITGDAIELLETDLDDETAGPLIQALVTRQRLLLDAFERENEQFEADLEIIRIDSLSSIRSSLIGRAMERSYLNCIQEYGSGSDRRRKNIINGTLSNEDIFSNLMRSFRDMFRTKADESQQRIHEATTAYLDVVQETFDLVRSENVARESEQDPDFRLRVDEVTRTGRATIERVCRVINV